MKQDGSIGSGKGYLKATASNKDAQIVASAFGTESNITSTNALTIFSSTASYSFEKEFK